MREDGKIDYVEFPCTDLPSTRRFYEAAFGWRFAEYGPTYLAFENAGLDGGFQGNPAAAPARPLVVVFTRALEAMLTTVERAGGTITVPIFQFPGGRRFHFRDPAGNELAVWSET